MSPHIGDELAALLAGELSPADTAAVLRHAQTCPQCTQALHESLRAHIALTRASRLLRGIPAASAGTPETADDLPPLPVTRQPRRWLRAGAVAAAAALAAGTAISTYVLTQPATATQPATVEPARYRRWRAAARRPRHMAQSSWSVSAPRPGR